MKKYKIALSLTLLSSLMACNLFNNGSGSTDTSSSDDNVPVANTATVNMGNITTIPSGNGSSGVSTLTITNNLDDKVTLQSSTYTLGGSGDGKPQATTSSDSPADMSQCSSIPAHGSCSIGIHQPSSNNAQSQFIISAQYLDAATKKTYTTSNIVSYSDSIPTTDTGIRYSTQNNNLYNAPNNGTALTIPFQLMKSFKSLTATSSNSNPTFAPTISCPGNSYAAGTLCNLYVKVSNTGTNSIVTGQITVTGEASSDSSVAVQSNSKIQSNAQHVKSPKAKAANVGGSSSYLFDVPVTVTQNTAGNLLTSAINVVVDPADGTSAQTIMLLNNGTVGTIGNIAITGATPVTLVGASACSTLVAGASCQFKVNVNSNISGQSTVNITYNNGGTSGGSTGLLTFNVLYNAADSIPGLNLTSGQGNLNNVPTDTIQYYNILVNNTGNTTLSNIKFTDPSGQSPYFSWSTGSCDTTGAQTLAAGETCTLTLEYHPTAEGSGTLNINAIGDWSNSGGESQTYAASTLGLSYSSITGDAFLYVTPNYVSFAVRADGQDSVDQTFYVVNAGLNSTKIDSDSISFPSGINGFTVLDNACADKTLGVNDTCAINVRYGNTTTAISNVESQIIIGYKPNGSYQNDVTTFATLVFNSSLAASIYISDVKVVGPFLGDGSSSAAYQYINTSTNPLTATVTYTNKGTSEATGFNVALNNLPVGYAVDTAGSSCPTGINTGTLRATDTCKVVFYAVNPDGLYNPYSLAGEGFSFNLPGYSYNDAATGLNTNNFPIYANHYGNSNTVSVQTDVFAVVNTTVPTSVTAESGGTTDFVFSSNNPGTVITIPADQLQGFTVDNRTCTIPIEGEAQPATCTISIENSANFPAGTVHFSYYVTPFDVTDTPSKANSIINQGSFIIQ